MQYKTTRTTIAALAGALFFFGTGLCRATAFTRFNTNGVLTPEDDVLLIGGQQTEGVGTQVTTVQRIQERNLSIPITEGSLAVARSSFTATLLPNGDILIAGGITPGGAANTFEVYSSKFNCSSSAQVDATLGFRYAHTATLLKDATLGGKVLICGGFDNSAPASVLNTCVLFTPGLPMAAGACGLAPNGSFAAAASMNTARAGHTANLLRDGRVWLAGGIGAPCTTPPAANCSISNYVDPTELFNPAAGTGFFTSGAPLLAERAYHAAVMMGDGKVLIAGGLNNRDVLSNRGFLSSTEIFNPITNSITAGAPMAERKAMVSAALDIDGFVNIYGGLGNITTTFFNASAALPTIYPPPATGNDSFLVGPFTVGGPPATAWAGQAIGGGSSIFLPVKTILGTPMTGEIEDGSILFSQPALTFSAGSASLTPGVLSPLSGLRANMTGTNVFCTPLPLVNGPAGNCGNIQAINFNALPLAGIGGTVSLTPLPVASFTPDTLGAGSVLNFPGTLGNGGGASLTVTITAAGSHIQGSTALTLTLPEAYVNSTISAGNIVLSGATLVQPSSYTATFTSLTGNFAGPIFVNQDLLAADGLATLPVLNWTNPAGTINYTGLVGNHQFAGSVHPTEAGSAVTDQLTGMGGQPQVTVNKIDVSGGAFSVDIATIVLNAVEFGDEERYSEAGTAPNQWAFSARGYQWGFNTTALMTPTGDFQVFGGESCGIEVGYFPGNPAGAACVGPARAGIDYGGAAFAPMDFAHIPMMSNWTAGTSMTSPRSLHTTTVLPDGTVLIAGGSNGPNVLGSSEIFDPYRNTTKGAGPMVVARDEHTATLLVNGRVLLTGGFSTSPPPTASTGPTAASEMYFPNTQLWTPIPSMSTPRQNHTATLLADGRVLVAGGYGGIPGSPVGNYLQSIEIYDPITGRWSRGPDMSVARAQHQATLLQDGRVLVTMGISTSGVLNSNEIFTPPVGPCLPAACGRWDPAAALAGVPLPRLRSHRSNLLFDGRVMVSGGDDGFGETVASYLYTPGSGVGSLGSWSTTAGNTMQVARTEHASVLLPDGRILVTGGAQISMSNALTTTETFDIATSSWQIVGNLVGPHVGQGMVLTPRSGLPGQSVANIFTVGGSGNVLSGNSGGTFVQKAIDTNLFQGTLDANTLNGTPTLRVSSITATDIGLAGFPFDRGSTVTLYGFNFEGQTEGNSGDGVNNSVQYHPHFVIQSLNNSGGVSSQGEGGFAIDMTRFIYQNYNAVSPALNSWTKIDSSITIQMPGYDPVTMGGYPAPGGAILPYGWYQARTASNDQFSDAVVLQSGPTLPGAISQPIPAGQIGTTAIYTGIGTSSLTWTWTAPAGNPPCSAELGGVCGYDIYTASSAVFLSTQAPSGVPAQSFTVSGLVPNTQDSIEVAAFNLSGDGPLAVSATYFTYAVPPILVSLASVTVNTILVQWSCVNNSPGTVYEVSMSTDNADPCAFNVPRAATCTANGFAPFTTSISTPLLINQNFPDTTNFALIQGLSANTTYSFRVQAYNGNNVPTGFAPQFNAFPPFGQVFVSTQTHDQVTLIQGTAQDTISILWTWTGSVPPINPAQGDKYIVWNATANLVIGSTTNPTFLDVVGATNTQREIAISVLTQAGMGPLIPGPTVFTMAAQPLPGVPPFDPTSFSTGGFTAQWLPNQNPIPPTRYLTVVTAVGGLASPASSTTTFPGNIIGEVIQGLGPPASLFNVQVYAHNGDGVSTAFTNLGTTSTLAIAPSNLTLTGTNATSISFTWSANGNSSSATYQVDYSTDNFLTSDIIWRPFSLHSNITSDTISGLLTGATYSIRIQAENIFGAVTGFSNIITTSPFNGGAPAGAFQCVIQRGQNNECSGFVIGGNAPRFVDIKVPIGALPVGTLVTLSTMPAVPASPCGNGGLTIGVNITTLPPVQPTAPVFLTVGYTNADIPPGTNLVQVAMQRVDVTGACVPLSTTFDTTDQLVTAEVNHFTVFQAGTVLASASVDNTAIFPNPFYPSRGQGYVTFANMPAYAHIRIYTPHGELVNEAAANGSGLWIWPGTNEAGRSVASGVYMAAIESGDAKRIFKVVVLR